MTELERLESMVPPFVREDPVMHTFYAAAAPELEAAGAAVADLPNQIWPHLATWGIDRLERVFGVATDHSLPLESRRSALVARLRGSGTSTLAQIKAIAESFSNSALAISERFGEYTVEIEFIDELGVPPYLDSLKAALRAAVPAHLDIEFIMKWFTMGELKAAGVTWGQLQSAGVTWEQLKTYEVT
jgi:hypothetical protein